MQNLFRCDGCERLCRVEVDCCEPPTEKPRHCLYDGHSMPGTLNIGRWHRVVEIVTYRDVPDDYDPLAAFRRGA